MARVRRNWAAVGASMSIALGVAGCACESRVGKPAATFERQGDEIVICGQFFHTGAPVVLWIDPGGYDAYRVEPRFATSSPAQGGGRSGGASDSQSGGALPDRARSGSLPSGARYGSLRKHVPEDVAQIVRSQGWSLPLLRPYVTQIVLHYDASGTSRRCFEVLQDRRGLSVHFMLDLDGTIYQTLDVKERAWHADIANDRSVGVEIANIGAFADETPLREWYARGADGRVAIRIPSAGQSGVPGDSGLRTPNFVGRPARAGLIQGEVQGRKLVQYDFTDAQYESLARLVATLCAALPEIRADVPRDGRGALIASRLADEQIREFHGLLGHFHTSREKVDPGPAFDWERLLRGVGSHSR